MKRRCPVSVLVLAAACLLRAAGSAPEIGRRFPAFNLPDQNGQLQSLRSLLMPKGAVILIYRLADCSPTCKAQLLELDHDRDAFHKLGLGVAAISYGAAPGWFVLDPKGVVVAKYAEDDVAQRYTSAAILAHQFGWTPPGPAHPVEGKQLTAILGSSNVVVSPGQRIALTLDIDLAPNMHVYAPGVEGYIPIDWKMQDSSAVQLYPPTFPTPEKLYLKAIDETVPAYRGHFRLVRDVTIAHAGSGSFTLEGALRYQACDDRVCYIPQELRLRWFFDY